MNSRRGVDILLKLICIAADIRAHVPFFGTLRRVVVRVGWSPLPGKAPVQRPEPANSGGADPLVNHA
ncbi:MAG: hypothetical protein D6744_12820 [Planctomycetota bacterium]|nr:MAG: hypothetical protein D6744_12820 [Planctomycetota bacterium]